MPDIRKVTLTMIPQASDYVHLVGHVERDGECKKRFRQASRLRHSSLHCGNSRDLPDVPGFMLLHPAVHTRILYRLSSDAVALTIFQCLHDSAELISVLVRMKRVDRDKGLGLERIDEALERCDIGVAAAV